MRRWVKVTLPQKRTASGEKKNEKDKRLGGNSGQPHWSVLAFFGPVALLQENTNQNKLCMIYSFVPC